VIVIDLPHPAANIASDCCTLANVEGIHGQASGIRSVKDSHILCTLPSLLFLTRNFCPSSPFVQVAVQLNDTHPSIGVAELMRLLIDVHHMGWSQAWSIVCKVTPPPTHEQFRA